jgi:hypothetical protein
MLREDEIKRFNDWHSVVNHPGYVANIDEKTAKLVKIIGPIDLPEKHPCGLAGCQQPHAKGWMVVDATNRSTNIGSTCGPKHFPDLGTLKLQFMDVDRSVRAKERLRIWHVRQPEVMKHITDIQEQPFGLAWLHRMTKVLTEKLPRQVLSDLRLRARRGERTVYEERRRSQAEFESLVARGERAETARYERTPIGEIAGLETLAPSNDINQLLGQKIKKPLMDVVTVTETSSVTRIEAAVKAADEAEALIPTLQDLSSACLAFCTAENLQIIARTARTQEDRQELAKLRFQLDPPALSRAK